MAFATEILPRVSALDRARLLGALFAGTAAMPAAAQTPGPPPAFAVCSTCHATEPGKTRIGPSLAGVAGRQAGSLAGFRYSSAMQSSGLVWDAASLDRFIAAPAATVPGTHMTFAGLKDPQRRGEVVSYLFSLHNEMPRVEP